MTILEKKPFQWGDEKNKTEETLKVPEPIKDDDGLSSTSAVTALNEHVKNEWKILADFIKNKANKK